MADEEKKDGAETPEKSEKKSDDKKNSKLVQEGNQKFDDNVTFISNGKRDKLLGPKGKAQKMHKLTAERLAHKGYGDVQK